MRLTTNLVRLLSLPALWWIAILMPGFAARPAPAQQATLAWKWRQGDERRYVVNSRFEQVITHDRRINQQEGTPDPVPPALRSRPEYRQSAVPTNQRTIVCDQTFHILERVISADQGGITTISWTYERVQVQGTDTTSQGTDTFSYDSARGMPTTQQPTSTPDNRSPRQRLQDPTPAPRTSPASPPIPASARDNADHPYIAPFASLAGRVVTYQIGPDGRVISCTGGEEAFEGTFSSLNGDTPMNPAMATFSGGVTNEGIARSFDQALSMIPGREVRRGENWTMDLRQTFPLLGVLRSSVRCTLGRLAGRPGAQIATVNSRGEWILEGGPFGQGGTTGLLDVRLTTSEMTGSMEFDVEGGFVRAQEQRATSEWEIYAPDFDNPDRMLEPSRTHQRLDQHMKLRLLP